MTNCLDVTHINNDVNGNPRFVVHFLSLLTDAENKSRIINTSQGYALALDRASCIGGKKFHNKQFGGGIVFQSYSGTIEKDILGAFERFENSADYVYAHNQIYLTAINTRETYEKALQIVEKHLKAPTWNSNPVAEITMLLQETWKGRKPSGHKFRLAAVLVALDLESSINESK